METRREQLALTQLRRASAGVFLILLLVVFAGSFGCGDDDEARISGEGGLEILQPQTSQQVRTHSAYFEVSLAGNLNPAGLRMFLNGQDVSSHLRIHGSSADGYISGMTPGVNSLLFQAPASGGGAATAIVQFTFAPKSIASIELGDTISQAGLVGEVEVLVDPWGIHHIYTMEDNPDDLAFIQGYITAKHRLFQMDFFRKVAEGRLAELLGTALDPSVLETDLFLRTICLTHERGSVELIYNVLVEEMQQAYPDKLAVVTRYVEGANAYIDDLLAGRNGAVWPQQHRLLNLLFGNYQLEHFTEAQILAIGRLQQWDLSNTLYEEIRLRAISASILAAEEAGLIPEGTLPDIIRSEPPDHATVLKPGEAYYDGGVPTGGSQTSLRSLQTASAVKGQDNIQRLQQVLGRLDRIQRTVWGSSNRPFSNNWIVSPALTASGFAMLCNDPHLGLSNPSIFYPVHGDNKTFSGGRLNFSGCTFPGIPGLMLGQNERMAWGGTVTCYDVTDVYEETVTVEGDNKWVTYDGGLIPVETTTQQFLIRGGDPITIRIDYVPHHGPQVPGDPYSENPGLSPENNLTVQWTGHYITQDLAAFLGLLEGEGIDDFFAALVNFGVGAQNFVGADVNGEIAYFPHALIPVRKPAALTHETPPWLPLPGTGGYEWETDETGRPLFLASEQIPQARNPARGWLLTANNDITGQTLDNDPLNDAVYIAYGFSEGFRNSRASELLTGLETEERDPEHMKVIQGDHLSLLARRLRPYFLDAVDNQDVLSGYPEEVRGRLAEAAARVQNWDLRCRAGVPDPFTNEEPSSADVDSSIASSLFVVWVNRLMEFWLDDELTAAGLGASFGDAERVRALLHILDHVGESEGSPYQVHTLSAAGESLLWDNVGTPEEESRDEIMVAAMAQALQDLDSMMESSDMNTWRWGNIHTLTFRLEGLGNVISAYNLPSYSLLEQIFGGDLKGYPRDGGWDTVDPANHALHGLDFSTGGGPAMRMVVELEEGVMTAFNVLPGGVNDLQPLAGPFKPVEIDPETHYGDQIQIYLDNEYRPQLIFLEDVTAVATSRLLFEP